MSTDRLNLTYKKRHFSISHFINKSLRETPRSIDYNSSKIVGVSTFSLHDEDSRVKIY